jgi:hypothetical protein
MNGNRPKVATGRGKAIRFFLTMAALVIGVPLMGRGCGSCMGYQDVVMDRLNGCPAAREVLGSPIKPALIGLSCGSAKTSGSTGRARWTMSVSGPKARGRYSFHVVKEGGPWRLVSGNLKAEGKNIDVGLCAVVGGDSSFAATQRLTGEVTSIVGAAPVAQGTTCTATVTPGGGDKPCRAEVKCGGKIIYGERPEVGYAACTMEQGPGGKACLVVQDRDFTPQGGDPALDLRVATGQLVVSDQLPTGMWVVNVKLAGGPAAPASAPAPTPAPTPAPAAPAPTPAPAAPAPAAPATPPAGGGTPI